MGDCCYLPRECADCNGPVQLPRDVVLVGAVVVTQYPEAVKRLHSEECPNG